MRSHRALHDRIVLAALSLALLAPGAAIGGGRSSDPLAIATDVEKDAGVRLKALRESIEAVKQGEIDRALWRETVKKIAWRAANFAKLRLPALEALLEDDEADTRNMMALMLPREPQRPVVDLICQTAAARGWTEATPAIVRSWSRKLLEPPEEERSERAAILALHPDEAPADVVFGVFATPPKTGGADPFGQRARTDAWTLLCRIDKDRARTKALLSESGAPAGDPMLDALRAGARDLGAVPATGEQLDWLQSLGKPEHAAFWAEASALVRALTDEQRAGLDLRHAAALVWASKRDSSLLTRSRADLLADTQQRIGGQKHHKRIAETTEGVPPPQETIGAFDAKLCWGDALFLAIAARAAQDESLRLPLFVQADDDRKDTTTEHGGVLDGAPVGKEGFVATDFPPRAAQRAADNRFIASPEMLEASVTGLFHFHFHARTSTEGEYAGPSAGDLEYASTFGRACLVFTSISRDTLGVDYYQPNGAVIDLGEIRRPSK